MRRVGSPEKWIEKEYHNYFIISTINSIGKEAKEYQEEPRIVL